MADPMNAQELARVLQALLAARRAEAPRLNTIHAYVKNKVCDIYVPQSATAEYRKLVDQAKFNILPLLVSSVAQGLFVDGYRPSGATKNADVWGAVWQANRMDARQSGIHRTALQYGVGYAVGLPGDVLDKALPFVITPYSPRRLTALYDDPIHGEWPDYAIAVGIPRYKAGSVSPLDMVVTVMVLDDEYVYTVDLPAGVVGVPVDGVDPLPFEGLAIDTQHVQVRRHGLGVCPVVRYLESYDDLDDGPQGVVYPFIPAQRRLNQTTFGLLMAQQHAVFRQRWVTGMAIPEDEDGNPYEPWNAAVNRIWHAESPDTKFGDFEETSLDGYLNSRDKDLLYIASARQIPPHTLVVGNAVSNVSAEALAALEAGHQLDIGEHKSAFGEAHEQLLRLGALAIGDTKTWEDTSAQVVWRDTTPRSLAQIADALGKLATQLDIPPRALWQMIPGVTEQDIQRWETLAGERDALGELGTLLAAPPAGAEDPEVIPDAEPAGTESDPALSAAGAPGS
ncbi:phage portal protein [Streptomyces sp. NPDC095602]|uniref:phage portal protein n=1 Tax=Streptomyces sp. NPDC095602 TaxID=3155819 RepID=UPI00332C0D3D